MMTAADALAAITTTACHGCEQIRRSPVHHSHGQVDSAHLALALSRR